MELRCRLRQREADAQLRCEDAERCGGLSAHAQLDRATAGGSKNELLALQQPAVITILSVRRRQFQEAKLQYLHSDIAVVHDHDRLPQLFRKLPADHAADDVGRAAWRKSNVKLDRHGGIVGGDGLCRSQAEQGRYHAKRRKKS